MKTPIAKPIMLATALILSAVTASLAEFEISNYTIDGGGGFSQGGGFELEGTIAQHDAGLTIGPMIGGSFELAGGFWQIMQVCACPGDVNNDGVKNGDDIQQFVRCLIAGDDCVCADLNLDGGIGPDDATQFVSDLISEASCL